MENKLSAIASEMVELYVDNAISYIDEEPLNQLVAMFEQVDTEDRAEVFIRFLTELREKGVNYDTEQFQINPGDVAGTA